MTQQTFAQFIGMSPASLSSIFNGRTKPTLNTVEAIRSKIPGISLDWLMFGSGSMYVDDTSNGDTTADRHDTNVKEQAIDFSDNNSTPLPGQSAGNYQQGVNITPKNITKTEVKYIDKPQRNITEIRVYFDDLTYESFVPKKM